jgi:sporulation protein YlmC with PRC-barrel domain
VTPDANPYVDLGKHVADKTITDRAGRRCGKADDLVLELAAGDGPVGERSLSVVAIVSGPLALASLLPPPLPALARGIYRLLGEPDPQPIAIPWSRVIAIDVVVHLDVDAEASGLRKLALAVDRRIIGRLPGAGAPAETITTKRPAGVERMSTTSQDTGRGERGPATALQVAARMLARCSAGSGTAGDPKLSLTYHDVVGRSVVTADGRLAGRIVDLHAQPDGERLGITALLVGPTAFLRRIATVAPARSIPWRVVNRIGNRVELDVTSAELARLDRERR